MIRDHYQFMYHENTAAALQECMIKSVSAALSCNPKCTSGALYSAAQAMVKATCYQFGDIWNFNSKIAAQTIMTSFTKIAKIHLKKERQKLMINKK